MGRLFASIWRANLTSGAPLINKAREPELECGGRSAKAQALRTNSRRGRSVPFASTRIGARSVRRGASTKLMKRAGSVVAQIWVHRPP